MVIDRSFFGRYATEEEQNRYRLDSERVNNEAQRLWQVAQANRDIIFPVRNGQLFLQIEALAREVTQWFSSDTQRELRNDIFVDLDDSIESLLQFRERYQILARETNSALSRAGRAAGETFGGQEGFRTRVDVGSAASGTNYLLWILGTAALLGGGYYLYRRARKSIPGKILEAQNAARRAVRRLAEDSDSGNEE